MRKIIDNFIKKRFCKEFCMNWKMNKLLIHHKQWWYNTSIQNVLNLNISTLAKYLFLYENHKKTINIVWKLSEIQKKELLQEVRVINLKEHPGRAWMRRLIEKLCDSV